MPAVRALLLVAVLAAAVPQPAAATAPPTPWCGGTAESTTDRLPDSIPAFQVHVVYAYPTNASDRFADRVSLIDTDMASMDAWWRKQDPTRTPRFDLAAFAGCPSTFGQLDVSSVRLPHEAAFYAPDQYNLLRADLDAAGFGDPDKKYLVYYDGPAVPSANGVFCGQSDSMVVDGGPQAYSIVYLGGFCGQTLGVGGATTVIATHELIHGLGALAIPASPPRPPHACPGDPGHPCDSTSDILYPSFGAGVTLDSLTLDVGRDDYYGHSGPWWDVQDSPFLARLDSPGLTPPGTPGTFFATSRADLVLLSWRASDDAGPVRYRVYRDGALLGKVTGLRFQDAAVEGRAYRYSVRAADSAGLLSPKATIRFKVGLGIVDDAGRLVQDTVPPPAIDVIHPRATPTSIVFSWRGVSDPGGLRGYRVERNGRLYALVTQPSVSIPRPRATARWAIRAVDRAGNIGPPARIIVR